MQKIRQQKILLIAAAVVLALVLVVAGDLVGNAGRIHHGVKVDSIALGGKTPAQARSYLNSELTRAKKHKLTVTYGKDSWMLDPSSMDIKYDVRQMVADAYQIGREKDVLSAASTRISSYFKPQAVMLRASLDETRAASAYQAIMKVTDVAPVNASVTLQGSDFVVSEGSDGRELRLHAMTNLVVIAGLSDESTVTAPVRTVERAISKQAAQTALEVAESATKDPVSVHYEVKTWNLDMAALRKLIAFKASNDLDKNVADLSLPKRKTSSGVQLVPVVDSGAVAKNVIPLMGTTVGTAPVPAKFSVSSGEVTIIPSINGMGADPVKLSKDLATQMQKAGGDRSVTVLTHEVVPEFTTQKAEALGIKERVSTFTTNFSAGNPARLNNITLLAQALDGTIVMPDATFSLNGTVGEANAAKGYQEAGAIVDGVLESQVGGGICQVNTTLFNAALYAGVRITERSNHSLYISSYPLGRDAAVSWPSPDFKFVNTLGHPILIATSSSKTSVTVSFYGVDPGYRVVLSPGVWVSRTPAPEQKVDDPSLPAGTQVVKQSGRGGGKVSFTQTVTKDGALVFEKTFNSLYKTEPTIIQVGTGPPAQQPAPTPGPTPAPAPDTGNPKPTPAAG